MSGSTKADVMISYRIPECGIPAKGGDNYAHELAALLRKAGYTVFVDVNALEVYVSVDVDSVMKLHALHTCMRLSSLLLQGGDQFPDIIQDAVRNCTAFVAICSTSYGSTPFTKMEYTLAYNKGKTIIPVYHSGTWPPSALELFLSGVNYVPKGSCATGPKAPSVGEVAKQVVDAMLAAKAKEELAKELEEKAKVNSSSFSPVRPALHSTTHTRILAAC